MTLYRCSFVDENDTIEDVEEIEVDALSDAVQQAVAMLRERWQYDAVQVWLGCRCIFERRRNEAEERFLRT